MLPRFFNKTALLTVIGVQSLLYSCPSISADRFLTLFNKTEKKSKKVVQQGSITPPMCAFMACPTRHLKPHPFTYAEHTAVKSLIEALPAFSENDLPLVQKVLGYVGNNYAPSWLLTQEVKGDCLRLQLSKENELYLIKTKKPATQTMFVAGTDVKFDELKIKELNSALSSSLNGRPVTRTSECKTCMITVTGKRKSRDKMLYTVTASHIDNNVDERLRLLTKASQ